MDTGAAAAAVGAGAVAEPCGSALTCGACIPPALLATSNNLETALGSAGSQAPGVAVTGGAGQAKRARPVGQRAPEGGPETRDA